MSVYTSKADIRKAINAIAGTAGDGKRPLIVLDLDGNILVGYNTEWNKPLQPGLPDNQNIPFDADIDALMQEGKITPALFADRGMDVRLPANLVKVLNELGVKGRPFDVAILTSRNLEAAEAILRASGVRHPEKIAFFADSGATAYVNGERVDNVTLADKEKDFLGGMLDQRAVLEEAINREIRQAGLDPAGRPRLFLEEKNIATTIHYREILSHYGQGEGSELDEKLGHAIQGVMQAYLERSPLNADGKKIFQLLDAPTALEIKFGAMDKGVGLKNIVELARKNGVEPSALVYAGDDICKQLGEKVVPGTDYHAFVSGPRIAEELGIPFYGIHTLHPADKSLPPIDANPQKTMPDPNKMLRPMTDHDAHPIEAKAEITINSPLMTGAIVGQVMQAVKRHEMPAYPLANPDRGERDLGA
jgi:hypothetical protein